MKCRICDHSQFDHRITWFSDDTSKFLCRYKLKKGRYIYYPCKCKIGNFVDLEVVGVEL